MIGTYPGSQIWAVPLNPADPGCRDDAGTLWDEPVVVRRCKPQPNIKESDRADEYAVGASGRARALSRARGRELANGAPHRRQPRGEVVGTSKLTAASVLSARHARADGATIADLARLNGVGETAMRRAVVGETWAHL